MRNLVAFALLLGLGACSAASSSNSSSSTQQSDEACAYPANADTLSGASGAGCSAAPPAQICQVSSGATVLPDGGVSGGTESCKSICEPSRYELTCTSGGAAASIPAPDPSLGCTIIPIPTPSSALFYCCPCAS